MTAASPVGISVLFCDLVGSTALAARVGASEAERLRTRYYELLRGAIERHGGTEVKSTGDGVMAVFAGVSAAMDAGVAMQQALDQHNRSGDERMDIRVGLSTGDCTPADGDYYGEAVIQAARLCDKASAGQILATAVMGLLAPRGSYEVNPVGELELKGLPEPVATIELSWNQLSAAGPVPLQERLTVRYGTHFVGRGDEHAVLAGALGDAARGERRVVLLTGEAGLGKTRLVSQFAGRAHEDGALVLYGRCDDDLASPYRPWAELLCHLVEHDRDDLLDGLSAPNVAELARIVPALRDRVEEDAPDAGDRYALFAAVTSLLRSLATNRTVMLILDDLHWADSESLGLLRHVVAELPSARLMIVGTYRQTDLEAGDALSNATAHLERESGVERLAMRGLDDGEVVELVQSVAGHELDDRGQSLAHALWAETSGSPFFVVEMLRHLAESGSITQGEDGRWTSTLELKDIELPQSVRAVVGQRVQRLGDAARRLLSVASVIGREFELTVLAHAADQGEDQVLDELERAMEAGLAAELDEGDRFTFTHALVQHTLYDELSASRRARLHRRIAEAIESVVGDEPGARVGELANHWLAAVQPSDRERAIGYARAAGDRALELLAPDDAVRWYAQALEVVPAGGRLRAELLVKLGEAERQAGHNVYREHLLEAARLAQEIGADDLLVEAALRNFRGWYSSIGEVDAERTVLLEAAIDRAGPAGSPERARLLATLAGELAFSGDKRRGESLNEALQIAHRIDDPVVTLDVIRRFGISLNMPEYWAERPALAAEAMRLSESHGDRATRFFALEAQLHVHLAEADMDGALRCDAERAAIAAELHQPMLRWFAGLGRTLLVLVGGDAEQAERLATEAFELGNELGQPDAMTFFGSFLLQIRWHQGRGVELIPLLEQFIEANPDLPYRSVLALFLTHAGKYAEANALADQLAADDYSFPPDVAWLSSTIYAAEAVCRLGRRPDAQTLYDRLAPSADYVATTRVNLTGAVAHYLGVLAMTLGRDAEAEAHLETAREMHTRLRAPFHLARTLLALERLLGERSPERAAQYAAEAVQLTERYGMPRLVEEERASKDRVAAASSSGA